MPKAKRNSKCWIVKQKPNKYGYTDIVDLDGVLRVVRVRCKTKEDYAKLFERRQPLGYWLRADRLNYGYVPKGWELRLLSEVEFELVRAYTHPRKRIIKELGEEFGIYEKKRRN